MKSSLRLALLALTIAAGASPAFAKTADLGVLTSGGTTFGNSFSFNTASFTDYYTFSIANPGTVSGTTTDTYFSWFFQRDVDLKSLTLYSGTSSTLLARDTSTNAFTFSGLKAGSYKLAVTGSVSGFSGQGSYSGTIKATSSPVAAPVPEASDIAMTAIGLAGVGFMARRRKAA